MAENGRELAARLEEILGAWQVPVTEIILLGHSMGGLVARSAMEQAQQMAWRKKLVTLETSHHGAPLEPIGHLVQMLG